MNWKKLRFWEREAKTPVRQAIGRYEDAWVLKVEHGLLRLVSLVFSIGSAYAIAEVFMPHNGNVVRLAVDLGIAGGFGVLGYFLSRSIAYRLMQGQGVWAYIPICLVVELVEIFCNYVMGVSEVPHAQWLQAIPLNQRPVITIGAYVVLSIIPAVTLFLAVADMDLERRKAQPQPKTLPASTYPQGNQGGYQGGYQGGRPSTPPQQPQRPQGGQQANIPKQAAAGQPVMTMPGVVTQ